MEDEIVLSAGETQAAILPAEGAGISRFTVEGKDILFPQQIFSTPEGPKKRGGIPILFPNADPLTEEQSLFHLRQHGFAREKTWRPEAVEKNRTVLTLAADEETRKEYPFPFLLQFEVAVSERELTLCLTIENPSPEKILPAAPGFHPYFAVDLAEKTKIKTDLSGFDPASYQGGPALFLPGQPSIFLEIPSLGRLILEASLEFKIWTVWSEPERPFICFEPWVGPCNALLHEEQRINLPPQGKIALSFKVKKLP